ncbi:hypothetical protein ACFQ1M_17440 [Sungkyunkwania multivorans]|uniref:Outer membrane protein beta-barrel domain-containing protein n=1 Tax=Sungkyunkwania multivorans TaxID=1173618 RepID=A0ABW3D4C8_9FLAO
MKSITRYLVTLILALLTQWLSAQEITRETSIESLKEKKEVVYSEEREALKAKVEAINQQLDNNELTKDEADKRKREAAELHASNIENRIAIIDNKIALLERKQEIREEDDDEYVNIRFKVDDVFDWRSDKRKKRRYDRRTTSDLVVAIGFNNAIQEGVSFDDSDYKFAGSRFFELGWAWKTRVFDNSNWLRIKYGFSFQFNGLKPTQNRYFIEQGDQTVLAEFPFELRKSKFRRDNIVIPVHFEFGPSRKIEREEYFRYSTRRRFKMGIGGYAGFNMSTRQKLKYTQDGERVKEKIKRDYNTDGLIYGVSAYVAIGSVGIYGKYDLSPIFKNAVNEQRNISLGVRFDMD